MTGRTSADIAATAVRALAAATAALALLPGCAEPPPAVGASVKPTGAVELPPAARLAASAARAQDQYYNATYTYTSARGAGGGSVKIQRTVQGFAIEQSLPANSVSVATSTSIVDHTTGSFFCRTTPAGGGCVPKGQAGKSVETSAPERLRLAFTSWLRLLGRNSASLSVAVAAPPSGASGSCFSVEGLAAAVDPPVDAGIYCFDESGRITALRLAVGTIVVSAFSPAPPTVALPAPIAPALPSTTLPSPSPGALPSPGAGALPTASAAPGRGARPGASPRPRSGDR